MRVGVKRIANSQIHAIKATKCALPLIPGIDRHGTNDESFIERWIIVVCLHEGRVAMGGTER